MARFKVPWLLLSGGRAHIYILFPLPCNLDTLSFTDIICKCFPLSRSHQDDLYIIYRIVGFDWDLKIVASMTRFLPLAYAATLKMDSVRSPKPNPQPLQPNSSHPRGSLTVTLRFFIHSTTPFGCVTIPLLRVLFHFGTESISEP